MPQNVPLPRRLRAGLAALVITLCLTGLVVLFQDVQRKIEGLATASSDMVQWTLAQTDVEFLSLRAATAGAIAGNQDLAELRKRFDVLYARVQTLNEGSTFALLQQDAEFGRATATLVAWIAGTVPLIDGPDQGLLAALPQLSVELDRIRPEVRNVALSGLRVFSSISDAEREGVATTLTTVAVLTFLMILGLLSMVLVLWRLDRQSRRTAQITLETLDRLEAIITTALDGVIVANAQGQILDFNAAAETMFGYPRAQALGADLAQLVIPKDQRAAHAAGMARMRNGSVAKMTGAGRVRIEALRLGGEQFPAEISISKVISGGEVLFVAFLRDLSAEVAAERELMEARDKALAGERAKARLLAVMSHEMRTPLNGMLGMIELLEDTALTPRQREFLNVLQTSGRLLLHHVNDVLHIARLESGQHGLKEIPLDFTDLVREVFANQAPASQTNGNTLEIDPAAEKLILLADPIQLRQILMNLVGNAIKFTRNGLITVGYSVHRDAGQFELTVSDNGIGIAGEDLERIFEDFVTLDATYARSAGGTGLGLGITRRIIQVLGGTIRAESPQRRGTTFIVRLPYHPSDDVDLLNNVAAQMPAATPNLPPLQVAPLRILVVEDNAINRLVVREMLAKQGHLAQEAHDGDEGVRLATALRFDLILMDISMPRMDGVQATRAIRAGNGASAKCPIVALTANAMDDEVARFLEAGMQDVLVKPTNGKALAAALAKYCTDCSPSPAPLPAPDGPALLDAEVLHELIDTLGPERSRKMIANFLDQTDAALTDLLAQAPLIQEAEVLRRDLHKLCGATALFGAKALNQRLRVLEGMCKSGALDAARAGLDGIETLWHETVQAMGIMAQGLGRTH